MNLKQYLGTHLFYIVVIAIALVFGRAWLQEHDARLLAEEQIKKSEQQVEDLQKQIASNDAAAAKQVASVRALQQKTKTPEQAIAAIPSLSDVPINTRIGPTPGTAIVDIMPLFEDLAHCKEDAVELQACQVDYKAETAIAAHKDEQIVALQKKPRFWKRVISSLKTAAIGAVAAELLHIAIRGAL
jgi:cytoskeletal protein RodZ